jgi:hypothetical protein
MLGELSFGPDQPWLDLHTFLLIVVLLVFDIVDRPRCQPQSVCCSYVCSSLSQTIYFTTPLLIIVIPLLFLFPVFPFVFKYPLILVWAFILFS